MLVSAFGVEVGGPVQFGLEVEDGVPACAGLEPDVEDVHLLAELFVAAGALRSPGQECGCVVDVPGVGAFFFEEIDDALVDGLVVERGMALLAEEDRDGYAPDALAGDAPVGARGDHVGDSLLAPGGVPDDLGDLVEGALTEGGLGALLVEHRRFHADEPLLGGADDDGVVAAPAVRVGVLEAGGAEDGSFFSQEVDDDGVRFEDGEALIGFATGVALTAGVVDVLDFRQVVALAGVEVVDAMGGSGVDGSGALVGGDVLGDDAEDLAVEEWVLEDDAVEPGAGKAGDLDGIGQVAGCLDGFGQVGGYEIDCFAVGIHVRSSGHGAPEGYVGEVGVEGYGLGGGEGPGGGGPDDGEDPFACEGGVDGRWIAGQCVTDVDAGRCAARTRLRP